MRAIATENNNDALVEVIRQESIDPEIERRAKEGAFSCHWTLENKYEPYKEDIRKSLRKDGFVMQRERMVLGKEMYKISWH